VRDRLPKSRRSKIRVIPMEITAVRGKIARWNRRRVVIP
jgi:hypothetical protein